MHVYPILFVTLTNRRKPNQTETCWGACEKDT